MSNPPYDASQRPKEQVKQPLNPFMLWCKERRPTLVAEQPGTKPSDISKQLGELWRGMTEEEKRPFVEEAKRVKAEHEKNHPDFKRQHKKTKKLKEIAGGSSSSAPERTPTVTQQPKPTVQFSAGFVNTAPLNPNLAAAYQFQQHQGMRGAQGGAQSAQNFAANQLMMGMGGQQGMGQYGGLQYAFMQQQQQQGTSQQSQASGGQAPRPQGTPNVPTTNANTNPPTTRQGDLPFYF